MMLPKIKDATNVSDFQISVGVIRLTTHPTWLWANSTTAKLFLIVRNCLCEKRMVEH